MFLRLTATASTDASVHVRGALEFDAATPWEDLGLVVRPMLTADGMLTVGSPIGVRVTALTERDGGLHANLSAMFGELVDVPVSCGDLAFLREPLPSLLEPWHELGRHHVWPVARDLPIRGASGRMFTLRWTAPLEWIEERNGWVRVRASLDEGTTFDAWTQREAITARRPRRRHGGPSWQPDGGLVGCAPRSDRTHHVTHALIARGAPVRTWPSASAPEWAVVRGDESFLIQRHRDSDWVEILEAPGIRTNAARCHTIGWAAVSHLRLDVFARNGLQLAYRDGQVVVERAAAESPFRMGDRILRLGEETIVGEIPIEVIGDAIVGSDIIIGGGFDVVVLREGHELVVTPEIHPREAYDEMMERIRSGRFR